MISSQRLDQWRVAARKYGLAISVILLASVTPLSAQQSQQLTSPKIEGKVILGRVLFSADDDYLAHNVVGAAVRIYVTKRVSIEPEYLYMHYSANDQDQIVQPNVAFDLTDPTKRFVVYGIAGAGVLYHKGRYFGSDFVTRAPRVFDTSVTTWTASAGGGVKIFLTKRLFVSPEVRVGHEPSFRATINAGYVFGGRR
jgi:hypothetical protein